MKKVEVTEIIKTVQEKLPGGIFFTTSDVNGKANTMTIGWGGIIVMHGVPAFLAPVRLSRFSYENIKNNRYFTVSVPLHDMKNQVALAGTKSGRDIDKFDNTGLSTTTAQSVNVPIIKECELHIEAEIMSEADMVEDRITEDVAKRYYSNHDIHTFFIGKILECYYTDR